MAACQSRVLCVVSVLALVLVDFISTRQWAYACCSVPAPVIPVSVYICVCVCLCLCPCVYLAASLCLFYLSESVFVDGCWSVSLSVYVSLHLCLLFLPLPWNLPVYLFVLYVCFYFEILFALSSSLSLTGCVLLVCLSTNVSVCLYVAWYNVWSGSVPYLLSSSYLTDS